MVEPCIKALVVTLRPVDFTLGVIALLFGVVALTLGIIALVGSVTSLGVRQLCGIIRQPRFLLRQTCGLRSVVGGTGGGSHGGIGIVNSLSRLGGQLAQLGGSRRHHLGPILGVVLIVGRPLLNGHATLCSHSIPLGGKGASVGTAAADVNSANTSCITGPVIAPTPFSLMTVCIHADQSSKLVNLAITL